MALPIANVAKYELTLPSQQKTISFRPFLVKEEKILLVALESETCRRNVNGSKRHCQSVYIWCNRAR